MGRGCSGSSWPPGPRPTTCSTQPRTRNSWTDTRPDRDRHPVAQHDALTAAGCEPIFMDKASGELASRPALAKALLVANRPKDQLVVTELDRLGRSLEHLIELSNTLQERGRDGMMAMKPPLLQQYSPVT
ncbi:recombinase family protein [Nocardia sp. NPDC101769]|uniref:recombinase family protein n=1 Tax=Nocardia sp. NPDC101769 TaxID=3364333 RepID=UPI0037FF791B